MLLLQGDPLPLPSMTRLGLLLSNFTARLDHDLSFRILGLLKYCPAPPKTASAFCSESNPRASIKI